MKRHPSRASGLDAPEIEEPTQTPCEHCKGDGWIPTVDTLGLSFTERHGLPGEQRDDECSHCNGKGFHVEREQEDEREYAASRCDSCGGQGFSDHGNHIRAHWTEECTACDGSGER